MTPFWLALATATHAWGTPTVLIQQNIHGEEKEFVVARLGDFLAEEFDKEGRLGPVTVSLTDPIFRSWVDQGRVPDFRDTLSLDQIRKLQKSMDIEYLALIDTERIKGQLNIRLDLFKGNKKIFEEGMSPGKVVIGEKEDVFAEMRSAIHTLYVHMTESVLSKSRPQPKLPDIKVDPPLVPEHRDPGPLKPTNTVKDPPQTNKQPAKQADPPVQESKSPALGQAQKLEADHQYGKAINILRDAIDTDPTSPDLRVELINCLIALKDYDAAAQEAKRSGLLMPSQKQFKELEAKAYELSGKHSEARDALTNAAMKSPKDRATRLSLARVALLEDQAAAAEAHCNAVLAAGPEPSAFLYRWLARLEIGDFEGALSDATQVKEQRGVVGDSAKNWIEVYDHVIVHEAELVKLIAQKASVNKDDPNLGLGPAMDMVSSLVSMLQTVKLPTNFEKSNARRVLALKLLNEGCAGIAQYLSTNDADLVDTRIAIGDAVRQMKLAKDVLQTELGR